MKKLIIFATLLAGIFSSCHKEEIDRYRLAGPWELKTLELTFFDESGNVDSTSTISGAGVLQLWDTDAYDNICDYEFSAPPPSFAYFAGQAQMDPLLGKCWWVAGPGSTDRLTLWAEAPSIDPFVLYTVTDLKRNSMTLTYVQTNSNGNMVMKEVWKMEAH